MSYLIQGVFFQGRLELGVNYRPGLGTIAVAGSSLAQYLFSGAVWLANGKLRGVIQDVFGTADISDIMISESGIAFYKRYKNRSDAIDYSFTVRDGASWVGEYSGLLTGSGVARCLVTEVPDAFFDAATIMSVLGRKTAFEGLPLSSAGTKG